MTHMDVSDDRRDILAQKLSAIQNADWTNSGGQESAT